MISSKKLQQQQRQTFEIAEDFASGAKFLRGGRRLDGDLPSLSFQRVAVMDFSVCF